MKVATQPAHRDCHSYDRQIRYSRSYNITPCGQTAGVNKGPSMRGLVRLLDPLVGERWRADSVCCGPLEGHVSPGEISLLNYQHTKWGDFFEKLVGCCLGIGQFSWQQA